MLGALARVRWRHDRASLVAGTLLTVVLALATAASFPNVMGSTEAERLAATRQLTELASYMVWLLPYPVQVDTLAGFVQWRAFGGLTIIMTVWAVLAGATALRIDEEHGRLDLWLAAGVARRGWVAAHAVSFALGTLVALSLAGVAAALGGLIAGGGLPLLRLAGSCLVLWALALAVYTTALTVAQIAGTARGGVGLATAVVGAAYVLNSSARGGGGLPALRWLSPFAWHDLSNPLTPGGEVAPEAVASLLALAALLTVVAGEIFARRDLDTPLLLRRGGGREPVWRPSDSPIWQSTTLALLYHERWTLVVDIVAAVAGAAALAGLARPIAALLVAMPATPGAARLLSQGDPERALLSAFLFGPLQLIVALYAVAAVGQWASDETSGRLALHLSAPVPRWRIGLARLLALAVALVGIAVAGGMTGIVAARANGIALDVGAVAVAAMVLAPFGLSFGAVGAVLVGVAPRVAAPALAAVVLASFALYEFGLIFDWPATVTNLSPFALYGLPLATGIAWPGLATLLTISVAGFGVGLVALQRRDIGP